MKSFHLCAKPHQDIIDGKFSMDVYAAKISEVYKQSENCPQEYLNADMFFKRTFPTKSFERILEDVKGRLEGDTKKNSFNNIQTPFGGGKTHSLVGLLHKAKEWNAKTIVLDGIELNPNKETFWGSIEEQLEGKIEKLTGDIPHGANELSKILEKHQPLLILIDETMHYIDNAKAIKVGDDTLGSLTVNFFQELNTAVSKLDKVCVVFTLPSSSNEHANDEESEKLFSRLKKVTGRTEKKIVPIDDIEIPNIIRRRLFIGTDEEILDKADEAITSFVEYCEREDILPDKVNAIEYRKQIERSYPFLPHVIDALYERWGTFVNFQRTRGVLRLLSLVVHSLITKYGDNASPFITLGDFDLSNNEIQRELIDQINNQFTGILSKDIISEHSGAKKIDKDMGNFSSSKLGERVATTIFMYSHSGSPDAKDGATIKEIKRSVCNENIIPATIDTVIQKAQDNLAFLHHINERFLFKLSGNLFKLKNDFVESLKPEIINDEKRQIITSNLSNSIFKKYIFPVNSKDVKDDSELKLVIVDNDLPKMQEILENYGDSPRINRNTIYFVCPNESDLLSFEKILKDKIAYQQLKDGNIVDKENKDELKRNLAKCENDLPTFVTKCYRSIWVLEKDSTLKNITATVPSVEESIGKHVYDELKQNDKITERLGPKTLKRDYLTDDFLDLKQIYNVFLRTPGEIRIKDEYILQQCIKDGVLNGDFGLGKLKDGKPTYDYWKEPCPVTIEEGEIIINPEKVSPPSEEPIISPEEPSPGFSPDSPPDDDVSVKKQLTINTNLPQSQSYNFSEIIPKIDRSFKKIQIHIECEDGEISEDVIEEIEIILKNMNANFDVM